jgi:O-antigen ligase
MTGWSKADSATAPFGPIGVCVYIAGFALPFPWDIPLLLLALFSLAAVACTPSLTRGAGSSLLVVAVGVFVAMRVLSIVLSPAPRRSLILSTPFVPAALLFVTMAAYCRTVRHTQALCVTLSALTLALASMVLWAAFRIGPTLHTRVAQVGSPILIEANDVTLLATTAPLSLALLQQNRRSGIAMLAGASLLASVGAISVLQSRTALVTIIASLLCAVTFGRSRHRVAFGFACALTVGVVSLMIDALVGFPLLQKFSRSWTAGERMSLWLSAWAMFREAPLFGQGAHTFVLFYQSYLTDLGLALPPRLIPWAHNLYLEVLAEQGMIGLTALGFLLFSGISTAYATQRTASRDIRPFAAGALSALTGFCMAAAIESSFLRQWVVIMLFVLLGLIVHLRNVSRFSEKEDSHGSQDLFSVDLPLGSARARECLHRLFRNADIAHESRSCPFVEPRRHAARTELQLHGRDLRSQQGLC